jgi:hypothetical protein
MRKTIMLLLLLTCGTARASEWVSIGKSHGGNSEEFVDVSSIRVAGNIRRAWIKSAVAPNYQKGGGEYANKWVSEYLTRSAFNCVDETARTEGLLVYYTDGTSYSGPAQSYPDPWSPVPPDTLQSAYMQFICAWKPK